MKRIYLILTIIGAITPYIFFMPFFAANGFDLIAFLSQLFANGPASGFTVDLLISSFVFWLWAYLDSRQHDVKKWWLIIPANLLVGLSMAMPLYFYLRAK